MCLTNNSDPIVQQFASFKLDLRSGSTIAPVGNMRFPGDLILHGSTVNPLIQCIYPDLSSIPPPHFQSFMDHVILAPQNDDVHILNHEMINMFKTSPRDTKFYYSADSAITQDDTSDSIPVEVLNEINVSGLPVFTLKAGCSVILLHNLST